MRLAAALLGFGVLRALAAQETPQASVLVREDKFGAELVEITMLRLNYPQDALRAIGERIGTETGTPSRGLFVYTAGYYGQNPKFQFLKCSFATVGLIDAEAGLLRLQPIVRAFAGAKGDARVEALTVSFVGERPRPHTLQTFASKAVEVKGSVLPDPAAIEYQVRILDQRPEAIEIPDRYTPAPPAARKPAPRPVGAAEIAIVGVGSLAAGALVYSWAVLRRRMRAPRNR